MNASLPSLPERPRAETLSVEDIVREAQAGRLRVPRFQTGQRWERKNVIDLFDSILRGFPIGSLLLWERPADAGRILWGSVEVEAQKEGAARFIVDGQQRVTALVGALLHPQERPLSDKHAVWLDLRRMEFFIPRAYQDIPQAAIPLNLLGDRHRLLGWSRTSDDPALIDRAFEAEASITRYALAVYVVRGTDEQALRHIFSRINTSGKPLNEVQVFQALFGDSREAHPIQALAQDLHDETRFGKLPEGWLFRCVKAVADLDPRHTFSMREALDPALITQTRSALLTTLRFLQSDAGFLHANLLPYRFPLLILARFFHLHPNPHPRNRLLLTRWLWRGALRAEHGNSSDPQLRKHLRDITLDESASVQRLIKRTPPLHEDKLPEPETDWFGQAMVSRVFATLLVQQGPLRVDAPLFLSVAEPWTPSQLQECLEREEPAKLFAPLGDAEALHVIAGRAFLPSGARPQDLLDAEPETLHSHLLSEAAVAALRAGDTHRFIALRAGLMRAALEQLVALRAGGEDGDRPPIQALLKAVGG